MVDHSLVEKIAADVGNTMFVVFWTYQANYSDPEIVIGKDAEHAFNRRFPQYANTKHPDFHKFAIKIQTSGDAMHGVGSKWDYIT